MGTSLIATPHWFESESPMQPGEIEYEFGVPIPGAILPEADWARTGVKRLPEPGPARLDVVLRPRGAVSFSTWVAATGGSLSAVRLLRPDHNHCAIDELPMVIRYATRRANQRGLHNVRFVVNDARYFVCRSCRRGLCRRGSPLPSSTLSRSPPSSSPGHHAAIPGRCPPGPCAVGSAGGPDRQSRLLELHGLG